MARFLGIDWDLGAQGQKPLLCVVEASVKHGRVTVQRAVSWPETIVPNPAEAEEAGRRLREHLKEAGIAPAPVLFAVGRERVVYRDVRYPDVPAEEVAAVVHYQAATELGFPAEEAVIDYALSSSPGPLGEKRALAFVLHKQLLRAIQKTCEAAGLRLDSVSVRPFALLANWQAQTGPNGKADTEVSAVFVASNGGGELCVARGSELLFSRAVTASASDNGHAAASGNGHYGSSDFLPELRRSLAAFGNQCPQSPVRTLFVAGDRVADGHSVLADRLGLKVLPFNPLSRTELPDLAHSEAFAGALGMIQARLKHRRLPIDFLAPKEPKPPVSRKKPYLIAAVAVSLIVVIGVGALYGLAVASRNDQIEVLQAKNTTLLNQIKEYGDVDKRQEAVNASYGGEMVMLDELYDLIARFPDLPGIRITKVAWAPAAPTANAALAAPSASPGLATKKGPKPVGHIALEASGNSATALERLHQALLLEKHWNVDDWEVDPLSPNQAKATIHVFHREPRDYTTVLGQTVNTTPVPSAEPPRAGPGRSGGRGRPPGGQGGGGGRGRRQGGQGGGGGRGRPNNRPAGGEQL